MKTEMIAVTPEIAAEWLSRNGRKNRSLSRQRVDTFARAMAQGDWKLTHQGIAFDDAGNLTDGQHRLKAIAESGKTIEMMVTRGVNDFEVIDSGRPRSHADVLGINGFRNANRTAATVRLLLHYQTGSARPWKGGHLSTAVDVAKFAEMNSSALPLSVIAGMRVSARIGGSGSAWSASHFVATRWSATRGVSVEFTGWWEGLETGTGLPSGDGRLALASWVNGAARTIHASSRSELIMMSALKAWHSHMVGAPLARIVIREPGLHTFFLPGDASGE